MHTTTITPRTFLLPGSTPTSSSIPISLPPADNLTSTELLAFKPFKTWLSKLQSSLSLQSSPSHEFHSAPYEIKGIEIQSVDWWGSREKGRIGFIKLVADVKNKDGESLPGGVFLRGGSVGMMVLLQPSDIPASSHEEQHVLLTLQPRLAAASLSFLELPAGMVDDAGTFAGAAAKEIEEELGITIPEAELINLSELALEMEDAKDAKGEGLVKAMFPSPGGSDEYLTLFLHRRRIPRAQLDDFNGKLTGLREEGEKITLKLVPVEKMWREAARDSKALAAWAIWMGARVEGRL